MHLQICQQNSQTVYNCKRFRPQILERLGIGEYLNISGVPVLPVIYAFCKTCKCFPELTILECNNGQALFDTPVPVSRT